MNSGKNLSSSLWGSLLRVDLSTGKWNVEKISEEVLKKYLGGRGLGVKILSDELDPTVPPLDQQNKLIFAAGALTGTSAPTAARYEAVTKSPLTGTITGANAGGYFGARLKQAGFDAIVIEGQAKSPKYLWINNQEVSVKDATMLWGCDTHETTTRIIKEIGKNKISVSCIGPAGERLVKFASIINDNHRAAGRGGVGAVLGAKLLKAIAITGSKKINIVDLKKFQERSSEILDKIKKTIVTKVNLHEFGTAKILDAVNDYRLLGTRNFQQNYFEHAADINAEKLKNTIFKKRNTCYSCPIACKRVTSVGDKSGEGPEFETIWAFGAQCGVNDLEAIARANYLCNELGLDTISTGNTIGCAMELSEKGLINEKFSFGEADVIEKLTRDIAHRKGIGDKLAEGSFRFAARLGYPELSMSVKKLELPAYDPRGAQAQGLGYATSTRGACHDRAFVIKSDMSAGPQKVDFETINRKTKLVKKMQDLMAVIDSIGVCLFSTFVCTIDDYWVLLNAAVGNWFETPKELLRTGERIWNLEHLFNRRAGITSEDDRLPARFTQEQITDMLGNEHVWPEKELITDYYRERGWTKNGMPTDKKLKELGVYPPTRRFKAI